LSKTIDQDSSIGMMTDTGRASFYEGPRL